MNRIPVVLLLFITIHFGALAQTAQTVRGTVVEKSTRMPLAGVNVIVVYSDPIIGTVTNENGEFVLSSVPIGRTSIQCSYVGFVPYRSEEFILSSAKAVTLSIELVEGTELEGVEVTAAKLVSEPMNDAALVSARSFSVEETDRISASVNDMGRMALSFPGVQKGGNDTENDVIVRGNSSFGILWRLEGIDIPNPNHFARPGTSGGGITVFSAQLLSRSDFFSGGLPAEYGNALSGTFDVHFKRGNLENREYRTRIGLLGLDFATEGPIKKSRSSYVANYRYSTLGLLNKMGFYLIGERVSNEFQDFSFNLYSKSKDNKTHLTLFGLGGKSKEHYEPVKDPLDRDPGVANEWEDRINSSDMGALGATVSHTINQKSFFTGVVAFMGSNIVREYDTLDLNNNRFRYNEQHYLDQRISTSFTFNYKFSNKVSLKAGTFNSYVFYDFSRHTLPRNSVTDINAQNQTVHFDGGGNALISQLYSSLNYQPGERFTINGGAHFLFLGINKTQALDPRVSFRYQLAKNQFISYATGIHSQMLPLPAYFFQLEGDAVNFDLPFLRSFHNIVSYILNINSLKITTEIYYQRLFQVPVSEDPTSTYWMLNNQDDFPVMKVVSDGTGYNKGIDVVIEKSFSNRFYFLTTGSLFDSKFKTPTSKYMNTRFNSMWSTTVTGGREFLLKKNRVIQIGGRLLYNGGFRYSPYDPVLSQQQGNYVIKAGEEWSGQVPAYFRIDARMAYRFNNPKYAGNISLDIQNLTSKANVNSVGYDPVLNSTYFRVYDGASFIPVLAFQFDF
jgi:hypothetical protein